MTSIAKIKKIGSSKGILFPKTILEESGIKNTVHISVKNKVIMISSADKTQKKNWSDFKRSKKIKSDFIVNSFDEIDWTW
jgi:antitoxin component of MazEF toxin-antitoxin module